MDPYSIINKYYPEGALRNILITHSRLVRDKAILAARNSGLPYNDEILSAGAMLHDIGIFLCNAPSIECFGNEPYIRHGILGAEILRNEGFPELARFCDRHTGAGLTKENIISQNLPLPHRDYLPETIEEKAVCYADKFYSKSGDIKREKQLVNVIESMRRHGSDSLERFMNLHNMFSKKGF